MAYSRERFKQKVAKVSDLQNQAKKIEESKERKKSSGKTSFIKDLEFCEGNNYIRLFPAHPDSKGKEYLVPGRICFLTVKKKVTDEDGNESIVLKQSPIFSSIDAGGTKKDIIEEYRSFVYKSAYTKYKGKENDKERNDFLAPLKAYPSGISIDNKFYAYGRLKNSETNGEWVHGRLKLPSTCFDFIKFENADGVEEGDEQVKACGFSTMDDAWLIRLTKKIEMNGKNKKVSYSYSMPKTSDKKSVVLDTMKDADFDWLGEQVPLDYQLRGSYKRADFNKAVKALKSFDKKNGYGVFEEDDFLVTLEEISSYYPEDENKRMDGFTNEEVYKEKVWRTDEDDVPSDKKDDYIGDEEEVEEEPKKKPVSKKAKPAPKKKVAEEVEEDDFDEEKDSDDEELDVENLTEEDIFEDDEFDV